MLSNFALAPLQERYRVSTPPAATSSALPTASGGFEDHKVTNVPFVPHCNLAYYAWIVPMPCPGGADGGFVQGRLMAVFLEDLR